MRAELSETSKLEQLRHAALLERMDAEKRARRIVVPTDDGEVRAMLRKLGHPVRLFGEAAADVRERLRTILARVEIEGEERDVVASLLAEAQQQQQQAKDDGSFSFQQRAQKRGFAVLSQGERDEVYTEASVELRRFREAVAAESFSRASARLEGQRRARDDVETSDEMEADAARCASKLSNLAASQSQFADPRPIAKVRASRWGFSGGGPGAPLIATGAWSGAVKVWDSESCDLVATLKCGDDRVTGLDWNPRHEGAMCVGLADGTAQLWLGVKGTRTKTTTPAEPEEEDQQQQQHEADPEAPRRALECRGHAQRLGNVGFHPHGGAFATTSFDLTWRLWDCETGAELLLQDGHDHPCYAIAFQGDGSLVATGDFAGVVLLWDLRSGREVHACLGHGKKCLAADFSPDGYRLATGSDDHSVRIWDIRRKVCDYVIPAHSALVSDVRWEPQSGEALATCAFDGSIALFSTRDFSPLGDPILKAHDGKTMSIDFLTTTTRAAAPRRRGLTDSRAARAAGDVALVSAGFDRTFKLWTAEHYADPLDEDEEPDAHHLHDDDQ